MEAATVSRRFDIPGALRFEPVAGGLARAVISTPAVEADLYLQGAHLAHWTPRGERPILFVSSKSVFATGKAIRGGIPIIFPWFGNRSDGNRGPAHGFARTSEWTVEGSQLREDGSVEIALTLASNEAMRELFDSAFRLRLRVTIGSELEMELEVWSHASVPFTFEEALHTYLAVGDVRQASIVGLENTVLIDKTDGFMRKRQDAEPVRIAKETDQVHLRTQATCTVWDPVWNRRIIIEKSGSNSTVVWNPWIDKSNDMSDMEGDGWRQMLCVETANAMGDGVLLSPGASHKMTAKIRLE
jgi:glucose-6-phosphate 1-epimerase